MSEKQPTGEQSCFQTLRGKKTVISSPFLIRFSAFQPGKWILISGQNKTPPQTESNVFDPHFNLQSVTLFIEALNK